MEQCDFCQRGKPLVIGKTDDYGVSINNISYVGYKLVAYGYDVHGYNTNGLSVKINYCPICGRNLNSKEYTPTIIEENKAEREE